MPVSIGLNTAILIRSARKTIVDECDVVTYQYIVLYVHAFANKTVTRNLAVLADGSTLLNFYESTHLTAIIDTAAIGVYKVEYLDVFPNFHIVERLFVGVDGEYFHDLWDLRIGDGGGRLSHYLLFTIHYLLMIVNSE